MKELADLDRAHDLANRALLDTAHGRCKSARRNAKKARDLFERVSTKIYTKG